jgi:hypothetical protein
MRQAIPFVERADVTMTSENSEASRIVKRISWPPPSLGLRLTVAVAGSLVAWWCQIYLVNGAHFPLSSNRSSLILWTVPFILCSALSIMLPLWALLVFTQILSRFGKLGNIISSVLLLLLSLWIMNALLKDWFANQNSGSARWTMSIVFVAGILLYPLPIMYMKRKATVQ